MLLVLEHNIWQSCQETKQNMYVIGKQHLFERSAACLFNFIQIVNFFRVSEDTSRILVRCKFKYFILDLDVVDVEENYRFRC